MSVSPPGTKRKLALLSLSALGVVYGDIGTSPLYTVREAFYGHFAIPINPETVFGVMSSIVWTMVILVVIKYQSLLLKADHHGQGGILALLTLLTGEKVVRGRRRSAFVVLGLFGAALLYGDGIITPAISVLSATEGLLVAAPSLSRFVLPLTIVILIGIFMAQKKGTGSIGVVFGPVILIWMIVIAILGVRGILIHPQILGALNPIHAIRFFANYGQTGFFVLSAVVLAVTGGEALYADLGHFGRSPIRWSWFTVAFPALLLNYLGQGALLLDNPADAIHPFYELAPSWGQLPLVILATAATVVASQALISASFSLTQQLMNLGYIPRVQIIHTSAQHEGQIYAPLVNTLLMLACLALVLMFRSSSALAGAYGLSVTGSMAVTSILFFFVAQERWGWGVLRAGLTAGSFLFVELALLSANIPKLLHGGWFPIVVGILIYTLMSTWRKGRLLLTDTFKGSILEMGPFLKEVGSRNPPRVPGTAVFMTREIDGVPPVLLHHLKHNEVLHKQVVLFTVLPERVPDVPPEERIRVQELDKGFYRIILRHGFMETPNVTKALAETKIGDKPFNLARTTFYLGRETILPTGRSRMARWRKQLFGVMARNANPATSFFGIPPNRVVELGTQVAL